MHFVFVFRTEPQALSEVDPGNGELSTDVVPPALAVAVGDNQEESSDMITITGMLRRIKYNVITVMNMT